MEEEEEEEEEEAKEATLVDASGGGQGAEANDSPSVRKPSSSGARWTEENAANKKIESYGKLKDSFLPMAALSLRRRLATTGMTEEAC